MHQTESRESLSLNHSMQCGLLHKCIFVYITCFNLVYRKIISYYTCINSIEVLHVYGRTEQITLYTDNTNTQKKNIFCNCNRCRTYYDTYALKHQTHCYIILRVAPRKHFEFIKSGFANTIECERKGTKRLRAKFKSSWKLNPNNFKGQ